MRSNYTLQNSPSQQEGVEKTTKSDRREHPRLARALALLLAFMYTCWTVELGILCSSDLQSSTNTNNGG